MNIKQGVGNNLQMYGDQRDHNMLNKHGTLYLLPCFVYKNLYRSLIVCNFFLIPNLQSLWNI